MLDTEKKSDPTHPEVSMGKPELELGSTEIVNKEEERAYGTSPIPSHLPTTPPSPYQILCIFLIHDTVRKLDYYLLPFLSIMYFFNAVDRSNLGNAKTDGMDKDLGFRGEQYSLLILLFYVPNGLCDLPLNLLTKKWSGKVVLPSRTFPISYFFYELTRLRLGGLFC